MSGKHGTVVIIGVMCAGAGAAVFGCAEQTRKNQNARSVFSVIDPIPTPDVAAQWAISPYDADKRQRGILLLANAPFGGERVYVDLYKSALSDPDSGVRLAAIRGLALHGTPDSAPLIVPFLEDDDRLVRWEAAGALQRIHWDGAVEPLIERLDPAVEMEIDVRGAAATALGQYPERRVLNALIQALRDPSLLVTHAASQSLHILTGEDFGDNPKAWTRWLADAKSPFAGQQAFIYPVFHRSKRWYEWFMPFMSPPNEVAGHGTRAPAWGPRSLAGPARRYLRGRPPRHPHPHHRSGGGGATERQPLHASLQGDFR